MKYNIFVFTGSQNLILNFRLENNSMYNINIIVKVIQQFNLKIFIDALDVFGSLIYVDKHDHHVL